MTDTIREAFRSGIGKLRYLPHEMGINPITGNYDDPRVYADYLVWKAAQAEARAEREKARALVGELVYALQSDTGGLAAITKAQAFMEQTR